MFEIILKCGEEFHFSNYKLFYMDEKSIHFKIQLKPNGRYIPRDRIIKMKDAKNIKKPCRIVLFRSMIESTNFEFKYKQKNKFEIIGMLCQRLGRVPTESEIKEVRT